MIKCMYGEIEFDQLKLQDTPMDKNVIGSLKTNGTHVPNQNKGHFL